MNPNSSRPWLGAAVVSGIVYFAIGRLLALPAGNVKLWRLLAWVLCGIAYAAHILWERYARGAAPRTGANHVAVGVALGAALLAVAAMIHTRNAGRSIDSMWLLALVAWPVITAIPAWLGAWVAGVVLTRMPRRSGS